MIKVVLLRSVNLVSTILLKNELENSNFCLSLLEQKFFHSFFGINEENKHKKPFETNLPLVIKKATNKYLVNQLNGLLKGKKEI